MHMTRVRRQLQAPALAQIKLKDSHAHLLLIMTSTGSPCTRAKPTKELCSKLCRNSQPDSPCLQSADSA